MITSQSPCLSPPSSLSVCSQDTATPGATALRQRFARPERESPRHRRTQPTHPKQRHHHQRTVGWSPADYDHSGYPSPRRLSESEKQFMPVYWGVRAGIDQSLPAILSPSSVHKIKYAMHTTDTTVRIDVAVCFTRPSVVDTETAVDQTVSLVHRNIQIHIAYDTDTIECTPMSTTFIISVLRASSTMRAQPILLRTFRSHAPFNYRTVNKPSTPAPVVDGTLRLCARTTYYTNLARKIVSLWIDPDHRMMHVDILTTANWKQWIMNNIYNLTTVRHKYWNLCAEIKCTFTTFIVATANTTIDIHFFDETDNSGYYEFSMLYFIVQDTTEVPPVLVRFRQLNTDSTTDRCAVTAQHITSINTAIYDEIYYRTFNVKLDAPIDQLTDTIHRIVADLWSATTLMNT